MKTNVWSAEELMKQCERAEKTMNVDLLRNLQVRAQIRTVELLENLLMVMENNIGE